MRSTKRKVAKRRTRETRQSAQDANLHDRAGIMGGARLPDNIGLVQLTESPRIIWDDKACIVMAVAVPISKAWMRQHRSLFEALLASIS
jgi:hypothetical protein